MRCEVELRATLDRLTPAVDEVVAACEAEGLADAERRWALRTALWEAVANAILHGSDADPSQRVRIVATDDAGRLRVTVRHSGRGFAPGAVPDPRSPGRRGEPAGRGLLLIRALTDEVRFEGEGRALTFVLGRT